MALVQERQKATFSTEKMAHVIWGSKQRYDRFRTMQDFFDNDPLFKYSPDMYNKSREDILIRTAQISAKGISQFSLSEEMNYDGNVLCPPVIYFSTVHQAMVIPAFKVLATDEQIEEWLPKLTDYSAAGCYAQTELAHGSDVQNLQTTATFDKKTNEFIIHTPTVEATKFWPGDLGLTASHALVFCQIIVSKQNHGVHPLYIRIRDAQSHLPCQGVMAGDIGPKLGYASKDNGFLAFTNYRVPASSLLQRYIKVHPSGQVEKLGSPKVAYASMMIMRKTLCDLYNKFAGQALEIAIRYSLVRKQFRESKKEEITILDYQCQMDKLFPLLAEFYACNLGGLRIRALVEDNFARVKQSNDFSQLGLTHALLSGAKANYSYFVANTAEQCRLACGGHGFAHYSGLPNIYFDTVANVTLEGENTILNLQLARYMLKQLKHSFTKPAELPAYFKFLTDDSTPEKILELDGLERLLALNCKNLLVYAATRLTSQTAVSMKHAWDTQAGIALLRAAQSFIPYMNFVVFRQSINAVGDQAIQQVLTQLCKLYGAHMLLNNMHGLFLQNQIAGGQIAELRELKEQLLVEIRPNALALVESQGFSDNSLKTLIGCEDGEIYQRLYNFATKENSMNKKSVADGIFYIKKMKEISPRL